MQWALPAGVCKPEQPSSKRPSSQSGGTSQSRYNDDDDSFGLRATRLKGARDGAKLHPRSSTGLP